MHWNIVIVDQSHRQQPPDMNGELNSILIKTIDTINYGRLQSSQIFPVPTKIRAPTLFTRPSLCSLGSNQEGFEESNPQV